jgi:hypothetical protein
MLYVLVKTTGQSEHPSSGSHLCRRAAALRRRSLLAAALRRRSLRPESSDLDPAV